MANNTQLSKLYHSIIDNWDNVHFNGGTIYIYDTGVLCFTIAQHNNYFIVNSKPLNLTITLTTIEDVIQYINLAWYKIFNTIIPDYAKL